MKKSGKVYLIGAGPGDPELMTIKGVKALRNAQVVLYDALLDSAILDYAPPDSHKIYVGKRCGQHSMSQDEINLLMVQCAFQYDVVVRLKGGDPFVFGRGHEELDYLRAFDIQVELIPGISSTTSLPLLQTVPLTKRGVSEGFWVLTGTTQKHKLSRDLRLAAQSSATVVILMGMRKLEEICAIFSRLGREQLPVMVIQSGSTKSERVVVGTVSDIVARVQTQELTSPGIIVLGEVVRLHPEFIVEEVKYKWL